MVILADWEREQELIEIWQQSFGDGEEYIRMFLDRNGSRIKIVAYETDSKLVSVAYLLPVTYHAAGAETMACQYLYAAATLPEYRGRGYFSDILKYIRENMPEPVILVPGEASLAAYYEKQGLYMWQPECIPELARENEYVGCVAASVSMKDIGAAEYATARNKILAKGNYMEWDRHFMNYICHENKVCGGTQKEITIEDRTYIVMYRTEGEFLKVLEVLPKADSFKETNLPDRINWEECVQALLKETGAMRAKVCLNPPVMATDKLKVRAKEGYFNLTMG